MKIYFSFLAKQATPYTLHLTPYTIHHTPYTLPCFLPGNGVGFAVTLNEDLTVTENLAEGIRRTIQLFPNIRRFWDPCVLNNQITFRGLF